MWKLSISIFFNNKKRKSPFQLFGSNFLHFHLDFSQMHLIIINLKFDQIISLFWVKGEVSKLTINGIFEKISNKWWLSEFSSNLTIGGWN